MDTGRLLLCAGVILAPPLVWSVVVIVYTHRRRARLRAGRLSVAEVIERATRDHPKPQRAGHTTNLEEDRAADCHLGGTGLPVTGTSLRPVRRRCRSD